MFDHCKYQVLLFNSVIYVPFICHQVVTFDQEPLNPDFGLSTRNTARTTQKSSSGVTALGPPRNAAASSTTLGPLSSITDGDLSRTTLTVTGLVYNPMQLSFATSAARDIKVSLEDTHII